MISESWKIPFIGFLSQWRGGLLSKGVVERVRYFTSPPTGRKGYRISLSGATTTGQFNLDITRSVEGSPVLFRTGDFRHVHHSGPINITPVLPTLKISCGTKSSHAVENILQSLNATKECVREIIL